eukprot:CAMPEP_0202365904 /NCGR_PEP_ID=MMETSP1126-20121109/16736_1 /ASSEMBLY_ACC=CAM_ASM_000457 /TAXON_ID=3047 /ORGANISM="Dunaliella tertiolecta, Strain CCMP1320" /LENGTH=1645 /DNA_ID=CAMNT_0048960861 /DNA_START=31 /DNA_END=4971 /DNA_ORIENTATION=+
METKTGGVQALNTRGPLPAAGQLPTARRSRRATGRAAAPQQQQQQYQQQLRVCSSKAINARGPVASPRAVVPGSVVEPAVEVVQGSADAGAAQQQAPAMNQVADLETILQERDACGVGFIAHLKNLQSHTIVEQALQALGCMEHRGACSADDDSGDGAGLMLQVPWKLLKGEFPQLNEASSGVGMVFMPNDDALEAQCKAIYEANIAKEGMQLLGWRQVPVKHEVVGRFAKATQPRVWQVMVGGKPGVVGDELERELFVLRKAVEAERDAKLPAEKASDFYTCSLSNKTIIYKGMLRSVVVGQFYQDLVNPAFETSFAIYHRRFSTNTTPKWPLAQPMRILGHNGEINTLQGNLNWVASRENELTHPIWAGRDNALARLTSSANSDSANLDSVAEVMVRTGVEPSEALMALVPEAYRNHPDLVKTYPEAADFYEYWEGIQEGWDGPALLVFSDGKKVGARLDRNGLRPARFWQTKDDLIYVASEVGVLNDVLSNAEQVVAKGRLGPGQMVVADLESGTFMQNAEISRKVASRLPYKEMLQASLRRLSDLGESNFLTDATMDAPTLLRLQGASGLGAEDAQMVVEAMAQTGNEATYCMGDDIPLAVLSDKPHPLYNYFKQRFAQVTNPPIDPLREGLVMSMEMRLGKRGNLLQPDTDSYRQVALQSPILLESELSAIVNDKDLGSQLFRLSFEGGKEGGLASAISALCTQVEAAVKAGCQCVVLSDRADAASMDPKRPPIPALLAVGAVHHHLIRQGLRSDTSIVVDTLSCYTTHHAATLIGYGAHAICPHLAYETARQWRLSSRTQSLVKAGKVPNISIVDAQKNLKKSLEKGIMKILSKMGISLLQCYHGAQIFEAYGLGSDVVDTCFRGSVSRIGGMSLADLQREAESFWVKGFPEKPLTKLEDYGFIQSKPRGEYHANNQTMAKLLHKAIGLGKGSQANPEAYKAYQEHFEQSPVATLRDCLEYNSDRPPIDISEVEPADKIMARFCTGGMSLGAISRETHETIAIAMNRVGGKSNSGEGGEDPGRWLQLTDVDENGLSPSVPYLKGLRNGDIATSRIKQVASGRFGVTPEFAVNADQLEIKIAQGAKPGEGGQLPGGKVSPYIADLRRSKPGVPLISPPPHHDIYSIEDLAQLIHDLHQVNPYAKVSVKLVAEAGIGVVASGVAKANADIVQVSGHDGGTGASPISSIKHAGGPMEMGLAETHQVLVRNELRDRIIVRTDGGIRSGRDIMMGALLGADEYGFGTAAMIATGCIMARVCHTNNCPVGVATQREELRARFPGAPEDLVNYFHFVAEEVRADLAKLGYRSMDEIIGRADLLRQRQDLKLSKTAGLDLSYLTTYAGPCGLSSERIKQAAHSNGPQLDDEILADPEVMDAIKNDKTVKKSVGIVNVDRSALARVSGAIAKQHGNSGFLGSVQMQLQGSAGQSFACFNIQGMDVHLVGEANDYVGKSMSGGDISIVPPPNSSFQPETASLAGNTCLYGATGGRLFVNGRCGERFAVRNSMAEAVIEGAGDHCCEYMTGGTVVVLGPVGRNVAAGMTGGLGFFLDEEGDFCDKVNTEIVAIQKVVTSAGAAHLRELIQAHVDRTGSPKGKAVLANWDEMLPKFWQLVPPAEKNTPEVMVNPDVLPTPQPATGKAAVSA